MKEYVVVVQCDRVVSHTCAGFQCEWAFNARLDAFANYPKDAQIRYLPMSCGGCPGQATLRKLINLKRGLKKREGAGIDKVMVHLSSCMTRSNHHSPRCPHIDYIKAQVAEAGFDCVEDSRISPSAEKQRAAGKYSH
ncbi:MAG: CGGC domain-containing protein [Planctomycetes bacterium]|nr:CGGC domain-containing protein [Planctomycetota bacterium]